MSKKKLNTKTISKTFGSDGMLCWVTFSSPASKKGKVFTIVPQVETECGYADGQIEGYRAKAL